MLTQNSYRRMAGIGSYSLIEWREIVYDATIVFATVSLTASRTHDQMVQAARSGNKTSPRQYASGTSKKLNSSS